MANSKSDTKNTTQITQTQVRARTHIHKQTNEQAIEHKKQNFYVYKRFSM